VQVAQQAHAPERAAQGPACVSSDSLLRAARSEPVTQAMVAAKQYARVRLAGSPADSANRMQRA